MSHPLNPNIQFPSGLNANILGKVLSFATVESDPTIPQNLKDEFRFEKQNVEEAERNISTSEGNERAQNMWRRMRRMSLVALEDINRRITNIRLNVNWV